MARFWTSDLHLGHANIIGFCDRPWADVDAMNEALIERWNAVVGPRDLVVILGDLVLGRLADTLPLCRRLNGRKALVPGNHDRPWEHYHKRSLAHAQDWARRYYTDGDVTVVSHGRAVDVWLGQDKLPARACHFPYSSDARHGDRFAEYRPTDDGGWLLHGHVHDAWTVRDRQINVGVDVWNYEPVPEDWLLAIIEENR